MWLAKQLPTSALLALAWAVVAGGGPAAAHLGAPAFIIVPADHVLPGERTTLAVRL